MFTTYIISRNHCSFLHHLPSSTFIFFFHTRGENLWRCRQKPQEVTTSKSGINSRKYICILCATDLSYLEFNVSLFQNWHDHIYRQTTLNFLEHSRSNPWGCNVRQYYLRSLLTFWFWVWLRFAENSYKKRGLEAKIGSPVAVLPSTDFLPQ